MKKLLSAVCMATILALTAHAADGDTTSDAAKPKKPEMTAEQKAFRKEMVAKYDTNKDGKLSKEERAAMSPEDKAKWEKEFPPKPKKADGEKKEGETK
jgi:hypothetical protein